MPILKKHWHQQPAGTVKWILKHRNRNEKPEWWIFLGKGERMPLKRYLWITHVGEIPKNCVIRFKDGNPARCILSNLECITKGENGKRNRSTDPMIYEKVKAFFKTEEGKKVAKARGEKTLNWWKTQTKERRQMVAMYAKKRIKDDPGALLTDKMVAYFLTTHRPDLREEVMKDKELINLKRSQIKLKRLCKTLSSPQSPEEK